MYRDPRLQSARQRRRPNESEPGWSLRQRLETVRTGQFVYPRSIKQYQAGIYQRRIPVLVAVLAFVSAFSYLSTGGTLDAIFFSPVIAAMAAGAALGTVRRESNLDHVVGTCAALSALVTLAYATWLLAAASASLGEKLIWSFALIPLLLIGLFTVTIIGATPFWVVGRCLHHAGASLRCKNESSET